jgi:ribonucleoside-diphosphate reductase alpha chain
MIKIDVHKDILMSEQARELVTKYYTTKNETSAQEAYARAAQAFSAGDDELAQRIYDYASNGWFMYSSPVLSNAPNKDGQTNKGLPISCFLTFVPDSLEGLIDHSSELRWLSVKGGGVGGHWSAVRAVSDKAPGVIPFIHTVDADMTAYRQGTTRKGSYAAYLNINHPDIIEFLNIRVSTGGDINRKCFNIHNAVNITDEFMDCVRAGREWELKDPDSGVVRETVDARELWQRLLETRYRTGEPYLNFIDTANKALPQSMKDKGLKINGSNLCNEIHLPTNEERTAVCCLSSVNLEKYDEWKDTNMVADLITFLDNVLQYFIDNAPDELSKAIYSATQERSLGLGAMGFHSYLQSKNIAWESAIAKSLNIKMFKQIKEDALNATRKLATLRGSCPDCDGVRNSHLLAVAPNANSGIILGTSASIEPIKSNAYVHRTRVGSHLIKNRYLERVLEGLGKNDEETWNSIIAAKGSVLHLPFLSEYEKDVFKTAFELDQRWVVEHSADRQSFICQGQSVNLFFPAGADKAYVNRVHLDAYEKGLKGLYYLRTESEKSAESVNTKVERKALVDFDECLPCQG